MMDLARCWNDPLLQSKLTDASVERLVVAYSGGADSTCLMHLVSGLKTSRPRIGLHINHGLHPEALQWQRQCEQTCARLDMQFSCLSVDVPEQGSMETHARRERYAAFADFLQPGDLLLQAHHADDQVETALFNLFRGSAAVGLRGMPEERPVGAGHLIRPFLMLPKQTLIDYCRQQALPWIEDSSNLDESMDRSFLRHRVVPTIGERWSGFREAVLAAIDRDDSARRFMDEVAAEDLGVAMNDTNGLQLDSLRNLSAGRIRNVLGFWIRNSGFPYPPTKMLDVAVGTMLTQSPAVMGTWADCELNCFQHCLYLNRRRPPDDTEHSEEFAGTGSLNFGGGNLHWDTVKGAGLLMSGTYRIAARTGGETIRLRGSTRKLKKVLQEIGCPPWLREQLPLVFNGSELVAVPAVPAWNLPQLVSEESVAPTAEYGVQLRFQEI